MKKVWNVILLPLLTYLGTLIAPKYVVVDAPINYLWIFLIQIPVTIIVALIFIAISFLFVAIAAKASRASGAIVVTGVIVSFILASLAAVGELILINAFLPGVHYYGFWTYIIMAVVYGMLTAVTGSSSQKEER